MDILWTIRAFPPPLLFWFLQAFSVSFSLNEVKHFIQKRKKLVFFLRFCFEEKRCILYSCIHAYFMPSTASPPFSWFAKIADWKDGVPEKKKKYIYICSVFQYGNSYAESQTLAWHRPTKYWSVCISRAAVPLKEFPIQASHYRFPAPFLSTAITDLSSPLTFNSFLASLFTPI